MRHSQEARGPMTCLRSSGSCVGIGIGFSPRHRFTASHKWSPPLAVLLYCNLLPAAVVCQSSDLLLSLTRATVLRSIVVSPRFSSALHLQVCSSSSLRSKRFVCCNGRSHEVFLGCFLGGRRGGCRRARAQR